MYPSIPRYAIGKHRRVHSGEGYTNCVLGPVNRETVGVGIRNGGVICVYGAVRESCSLFIIALVSSYILPETPACPPGRSGAGRLRRDWGGLGLANRYTYTTRREL